MAANLKSFADETLMLLKRKLGQLFHNFLTQFKKAPKIEAWMGNHQHTYPHFR